MKKLKWRLFLHFSWQFLSISALMVIIIILTLIIAIGFMTRDEAKYNYYQAKLIDITMGTSSSLKDLQMVEGWDKDFKKEKIWVQIINNDGEVVEQSNVPDEIPNRYSSHELQKMQETKQLQGYALNFYLETYYESPYLFIMGHKEEAVVALQQIIQEYGENGIIAADEQPTVEKKLKAMSGLLELYDTDGNLLQRFGEGNVLEEEKALDVFLRETVPDIYATKRTAFREPQSGVLWVLHTPNEENHEVKLNNYRNLLIPLVVSAIVILFITILISAWNGFRYGNPLFIFSNWLRRMGNEQYEEVLTQRERKQVFRKNGKIKWRYKIYEEVIQSFYEMADKLEASKKERERLEKTREDWMTGISHDLRTPLTTIQGYGKLLESGQYDWSKEELQNIGQSVCEKSDHMMGLIEDFSLSFQLKNDALPVSFCQREINELLEEILAKFKHDNNFEDYSITLHSYHKPLKLAVEERLFERMLDNLIYNAVKHNPPGTKVAITVEEGEEGNLSIVIEDNGIGMDEETLKHLFNRYYRGTNTDEKIEGTGLGMSIAMQIAKVHKGTLTVESKEKIGTRVKIEFPIR